MYHHYDTIAYPEHPSKEKSVLEKLPGAGVVAGVVAGFKGLVPWGRRDTTEQEQAVFKLPSLEDMCKLCLHYYLQDHYAVLTDLEHPLEHNIVRVAGEIERIYRCLRCPKFMRDWWNSVDEMTQQRLPQVTEIHCTRDCPLAPTSAIVPVVPCITCVIMVSSLVIAQCV